MTYLTIGHPVAYVVVGLHVEAWRHARVIVQGVACMYGAHVPIAEVSAEDAHAIPDEWTQWIAVHRGGRWEQVTRDVALGVGRVASGGES